MTADIHRAAPDDLDAVAPLFHRYRTFYGQPDEPARSRAFLAERLARGESAVLLASREGEPAGFVQLYPAFSSVRLGRTWILNDLFVAPVQRRRGVARALLAAAAAFARADGALRLELETAPDNRATQALYRAAGRQRFDGTRRFRLPLDPAA